MADSLKIKSAGECRYDEVSLGEVMMRIDPGDVPTARARFARIWHGGGETNVAEGLAYCFGLRTAVVTALILGTGFFQYFFCVIWLLKQLNKGRWWFVWAKTKKSPLIIGIGKGE